MKQSVPRALLCLLVFLLGGGAACWGIHALLPFPEVMIVTAKVNHLAAHHDDYDTLFLGSSRFYHQIVPALFDELATAQGLPTRSFNAGVAGMHPPEDAFFLDAILRHPPRGLRWVFIELAPLRTPVGADKIHTMRAVYWHDWARLQMVFRRSFSGKPWRKKHFLHDFFADRGEHFPDLFDHVGLFLRNQTNIGRGSILMDGLMSRMAPSRSTGKVALGQRLDGWIPTGRPELIAGSELQEYEKSLAARRLEPATQDYDTPVSQQALAEMLSKVARLGATPVLVVPPTTSKHNFYPAPDTAPHVTVLDFSDLRKFPELYEKRYRLDTDHLNTEGASVFTRLLVQRWSEEVHSGQ